MNPIMEKMIEGKPKTAKRGSRNNWGKENYIYLLGVSGEMIRRAEEDPWWHQNKDITSASATILDSLTERMSECSIYLEKDRPYFKKNGVKYYLDTFVH